MKLFLLYIKQHRKGILVWTLFCLFFIVSFILYRLPLKAVIYPSLICLIFGVVFICIGFLNKMRKHNQIIIMKKLTADMISYMPSIECIEDSDYQEVIESLKSEVSQLNASTSERYKNLMEYYTLWVHQIKIPITSMQLTLQNEDTLISRKLSSDLSQISQYVEMVLAFMKLESDYNDYVFRKHNVGDIIKHSIARFASEFIDRKIRIEYDAIERIIVTDEKWFSFVIDQLLSNALKYTRKGSIKIYIKGAILCIEDTGIGIAPEDLSRIFEKGYTGYNGRIYKKASGIGLYLCKRICNNLEIDIYVTSELYKGTIVHINLEQNNFKRD
ncbi:sensor histidine kinase [Candidatus Arthromitus sp. SFB-rat-Yit]|uniref:sensor histidine kinase n=1 Tax=Candidatus Arthromitus sp. SFB-rat-Yit TaxID=1041504 RepID=UPI000227A401|nr:sensor histidine kinase [Candidatus Arthromitus sp. SFB-rat-Yit]BAK81505.1 histidine kinase [Candidatus Arthromitus sp. SFB-rat-Yit]